MYLMVRVTDAAAQSLRRKAPATPDSRQLLRTTRQHGLALQPMHPGVPDPSLEAFYTVEVPDYETAVKVLADLNKCPAVEAAYYKPPEALP